MGKSREWLGKRTWRKRKPQRVFHITEFLSACISAKFHENGAFDLRAGSQLDSNKKAMTIQVASIFVSPFSWPSQLIKEWFKLLNFILYIKAGCWVIRVLRGKRNPSCPRFWIWSKILLLLWWGIYPEMQQQEAFLFINITPEFSLNWFVEGRIECFVLLICDFCCQ